MRGEAAADGEEIAVTPVDERNRFRSYRARDEAAAAEEGIKTILDITDFNNLCFELILYISFQKYFIF